MSVPLETIENTFEEYRKAHYVLTSKDESDEARAKAGEVFRAKRLELDELLIEDKRAREEREIESILEARRRAALEVADASAPKTRPGNIDFTAVRDWLGKADDNARNLSFRIAPAMMEKRTEYDITTVAENAYGSRLIPQTWADTIAAAEVAMSGVLAAGPRIIRTASGAQMNFPTYSTKIVATAGTEGTDATQDTPVFGTVPLNNMRIDGYLVLTQELIRDSGPDVESFLAQQAGIALGEKMASYLGDIDVGTGANSIPAAITVGATSAVTAASKTAVTVNELKELFYSVLPVYRRNGEWIANSALTLALAQSTDDMGQYLWQPSNIASAPEIFMGKPWIEDAYFDASAAGNIPVVFGDVNRAYLVRLVGDIDISFSAEAGFTSFEVYMRYGQWFDAATIDASAVKGITLAS